MHVEEGKKHVSFILPYGLLLKLLLNISCGTCKATENKFENMMS